jgi:signal transduction histidine kinase
MTVADTGTGIHPEVRKKIFEPFFTTKGQSGTGLGLPLSLEIVGRHEGSLRVRSKQGLNNSGTVFTLFLPFGSAVEG